MAEFKKALNKSELKTGTGKTVAMDGKQIAVFNVEGQFYAIDNKCPHRGGPLGEGDLSGTQVTCPWHAWQYDVTSGAALHTPDVKVKVYGLKVEGEEILIEV